MLFLATGVDVNPLCQNVLDATGKSDFLFCADISGWRWFEMLRLFEKRSSGGRSPIVVGPSQPWRKTNFNGQRGQL